MSRKNKKGDLEWVMRIFLYAVLFFIALAALYFLFKKLL